jgi:hypothetical protein
MRNWYWL